AFFFSGYGRFLVVATRYLFAGFLAILADVRYFYTPQHPSDVPLPSPTVTVFLRSFTFPFSKIIHNEVENTGDMGDFILYLI
uniref:hypothetical protein n=1 Tax=Klebsiella variicola TaxID=244366 RepID=UPI001C65FF26